MKPTVLLPILLCISFYSCEPISYVRLVKDKIKETDTYLLTTTKYANSALKRKHQQFNLEFIKTNINPGKVDIFITTYLDPNDSDLSNEVYFMFGAQKMKYEMTNLKTSEVNENRVTNENYTTYQTTTKSVPVTTTESKMVNDQLVTETKTEMQTVNEQTPVQNTRQISRNVNYTVSKNKITIEEEQLKSLASHNNFYLRIYNNENDFWSIQFNQYNSRDLKNFINKIVAPHNIRVN
jgi:hypothetical protein